MAGMPNPDGPGVWLLAAKKIGAGMMRDGRFGRDPDTGTMTGTNVRLMVELADFIIIEGENYPDAFRKLFEQWTPGGDETRPQLEETRPAIAPRRPEIGGAL
jgi:hypothetical protein